MEEINTPCTVCEEEPQVFKYFICGHKICQKCYEEYKKYNLAFCLIEDCNQRFICTVDKPLDNVMDRKKELMIKFYCNMKDNSILENNMNYYNELLQNCYKSVAEETKKIKLAFKREVARNPAMVVHTERRLVEFELQLNAQRKEIEIVVQHYKLWYNEIKHICNLITTMINSNDYTYLDAAYERFKEYEKPQMIEFNKLKLLKFIILPDDADETIGNLVEDINLKIISCVRKYFSLAEYIYQGNIKITSSPSLPFMDSLDRCIIISSIGTIVYKHFTVRKIYNRNEFKPSTFTSRITLDINDGVCESCMIVSVSDEEYIIEKYMTYIHIWDQDKLIKKVQFIENEHSTDHIHFLNSYISPDLLNDILNNPEAESKTYYIRIN